MRWFPTAIVLVASTACAGVPPVERDVESLANFRGVSFTEAWDLAVGEFASRGWTIDNLERDSGIITSEWVSTEGDLYPSYRDCGSPGLRANLSNYRGRFTVVVRETDNGVSVEVTTDWEVTKSTSSSIGIAECFSTGLLEGEFHRALRRRGL